MNEEIDSDEAAVLAFLHQAKHATTDDLHRHVLSARPKIYVYRKLAKLIHGGYIAAHLLAPERGGGSPRVYHLLLKGARAIGLAALGSAHYSKPTREVYRARQVRHELALWADKYGWRLLTSEEVCQQAILGVLVQVARATSGECFPVHTITPVGLKVRPDLLLDTGKVLILVIVGHPQASAAFWKQRVERSVPILPAVRVVCFALTEQQQEDAAQAIAASVHAGRFLLLGAGQMENLIQRLAQE